MLRFHGMATPMRCWRIWHSLLLLLIAATLRGAAPAPVPTSPPATEPSRAPAVLSSYETPYYTIYSDLNGDAIREAKLRMTQMAEEYSRRTKGFSGAITAKMPFYLYAHLEDYLATGAPEGTAGYFNGEDLVAYAGGLEPATWVTVQHEGFHEFAHFVIRGDPPIWISEGLAEYFGEAVFTGEGFVTGVIPEFRLERVRRIMKEGGFKPLAEMMAMSRRQWNSDLTLTNYDQAWSMVQFLAHGENGRYQKGFGEFMVRVGKGANWQRAWDEIFGEPRVFEQRWREYWTKLPDHPTLDDYISANVRILTNFYARAFSQSQVFTTMDEFRAAAARDAVKSHPDEWLPPSLIKFGLGQAAILEQRGYGYAIVSPAHDRPQIVCTMPDGRRIIGTFMVRNRKVQSIKVTTVAAPVSR